MDDVYYSLVEKIRLFAFFKIDKVGYFQRRRNMEYRAHALWTIEELLTLIENERCAMKDISQHVDWREKIIKIVEDFIAQMDRFLALRYYIGFECAKGTASRLRKFLLEETL